jgi:hypothetical protein
MNTASANGGGFLRSKRSGRACSDGAAKNAKVARQGCVHFVSAPPFGSPWTATKEPDKGNPVFPTKQDEHSIRCGFCFFGSVENLFS